MSVVIETTLGDITVDLFTKQRPRACLNFLKLCKIKYYNYSLFHTISRGFIAQTGDPTGSRKGGESLFGALEGPLKRYFQAETVPRIKHTAPGLISFVGNEDGMIGSQFFFTLGADLGYLDAQHCVFGEVVEGMDVVELLNEVICDGDNRPYQDVRITHTVVLDDPFPDPERLVVPERSPSPTAERLQGGRIAPDEEIDETEGKSFTEVNEIIAEREAKARATILEMVGDIPDAEMAPPENVLFVCKLNPVTTDDDLEIIFSRFGKIKSSEVIRDKKTGDSLQYAFVEFEDKKACEDAYFKMDNVLIDDRRIHVDFSQSVAKIRWHGKGRGVTHFDDKGRKKGETRGIDRSLGEGKYEKQKYSDEEEYDSDHGVARKIGWKNQRDTMRRDNKYEQKRNENRFSRFKESEDRLKRNEQRYDRNEDRRRGQHDRDRSRRYEESRNFEERNNRSRRYYENRDRSNKRDKYESYRNEGRSKSSNDKDRRYRRDDDYTRKGDQREDQRRHREEVEVRSKRDDSRKEAKEDETTRKRTKNENKSRSSSNDSERNERKKSKKKKKRRNSSESS